MIVTDNDFNPEPPDWVTDPNVSAQDKQELLDAGYGEAWTWTHHEEMDDDCLLCGQKLSVPFVFWRGMTKTLHLHQDCAGRLGGALMRDCLDNRNGKDAADKWWKQLKAQLFGE
jgi:hypothetical protein